MSRTDEELQNALSDADPAAEPEASSAADADLSGEHHHHHHHHHHSDENGEHHHRHHSDENSEHHHHHHSDDDEENGKHHCHRRHRRRHRRHHRHHRHRKMGKGKKALLIILSVFLVMVLGVFTAYYVMHELGRDRIHDRGDVEVVVPTSDDSGNEIVSVDKYGRLINYNGVSYVYDDDVIAVTLIGVDNANGTVDGLPMSDVIYLLTINSKTGEAKVVGISRDTMTDVDIYSDEGTYIEAEQRQIAYSYAYHGKRTTGGDNTNKSISRLFFGLPCKNYFAINLDAFNTLNDAIGGVTLTSQMTFTSPVDGRVISEGETVTLQGKEAEYYIRTRSHDTVDANNDRMGHQQQYIRAFFSSAFQSAKKDITVVSDLYSAVTENSDSTLDLSQLTYIASVALSKVKSVDDIEFITLKGDIVKGEYAEMYVSTDEALKTMLDVFYRPIDQ